MLEQWELANFKPGYNFVVRQLRHWQSSLGHRHVAGGEVDTIFGMDLVKN
jgi:hypothetical protein